MYNWLTIAMQPHLYKLLASQIIIIIIIRANNSWNIE